MQVARTNGFDNFGREHEESIGEMSENVLKVNYFSGISREPRNIGNFMVAALAQYLRYIEISKLRRQDSDKEKT